MITLETIANLAKDDGITLRKGEPVTYKTGWQVATHGEETTDPQAALEIVKKYAGDCGIWFANGIYYVDKSMRVNTKKEALAIGRAHNQISIFGWKNKKLAYC